jgi:hypothetical protein
MTAASLAVLTRELLASPSQNGCHRNGYTAPETTVFLKHLTLVNSAVRHLLVPPE